MNIDIIINVVILFIIIMSLLKRVKEISKKGDEVKKMPEGPPDPLAETIKTEKQRAKEQSEPVRRSIREVFDEPRRGPAAPKQERPEAPPATPSLEDVFKRLSGEIIPEVQQTQSEPVAPEPQVPKPEPEPVPEPPSVRIPKVRKTYVQPRNQSPVLSFEGSEVVRGIIMGEILGPPVSMRSERVV